MHFVGRPDPMDEENAHNKRYRLIMAGYFEDWFQLERIWTSARKIAASRDATDALDDFFKQHDSPSTYKAKE